MRSLYLALHGINKCAHLDVSLASNQKTHRVYKIILQPLLPHNETINTLVSL